MKKGDLVRLVVHDSWSRNLANTHGYLWLAKSVDTRSVLCTSLATGEKFLFHIKSLEQANETD